MRAKSLQSFTHFYTREVEIEICQRQCRLLRASKECSRSFADAGHNEDRLLSASNRMISMELASVDRVRHGP